MRHDFLDGKYTVIFDETTGRLSALRYGEPWRDLVGDGMVLAMLQRVDALQQEVDALQRRIDGMKTDAALAGDCAGLPALTPAPQLAQPAAQDCDDLNKLGGQISSLLLERARELCELWGRACSDFDRGKAQIGQGGQREPVPAAPGDELAQAPGSSCERPRAG